MIRWLAWIVAPALQREVEQRDHDIEQLRAQNVSYARTVEEQGDRIAELLAQNAEVRRQNGDLQRQLREMGHG